MAIETAFIEEKLTQKFASKVSSFGLQKDIFSFEVTSDTIREVIIFLKEDQDLNFHFLTDLCGVNYPDNNGAELVVVYHLHNFIENIRIRFSIAVPVAKPDVFTATKLFESANWMERETYDFFGVNFIGHPNLKRILNVDEMDYFPLRKEFPLEDQTRIDKDDEMFGRG